MGRKPKRTMLGEYFEEKRPLAVRSVTARCVHRAPGRLPFYEPISRLRFWGPTPKLDWTGDDVAARLGPYVAENALFFLDTGIFSTVASKPLWDLFLSRQVLIVPTVWGEIQDWINCPRRNQDIRDIVQDSIKRQLALGEEGLDATPSDLVSKALSELRIQIRSPNERYRQHGYEYYYKLLALRKLVGPVIATVLERELGKHPGPSEVRMRAQRLFRERGAELAEKGLDWPEHKYPFADEQTVLLGVMTAILEGREVYVVTADGDLPEQFFKLHVLIKEHYRSMLAAEIYASDPKRMAFREVAVRDDEQDPFAWTEQSILRLRVPEHEFDVLPSKFSSTNVHCLWFSTDHTQPKFSYSGFAVESDVARVLRIKAATDGLSTDRFGERNCTIRTTALTSQHHEVIVSIGKERRVPAKGWGEFGADDFRNVLFACESITRVRVSEPTRGVTGSGELCLLLMDRRHLAQHRLTRLRDMLVRRIRYTFGQLKIVRGLTDLASLREAQANGAMLELWRLSDLDTRLALDLQNRALLSSTMARGQCVPPRKREDRRLAMTVDQWFAVRKRIFNSGFESDACVASFRKASLALIQSSLDELTQGKEAVERALRQ